MSEGQPMVIPDTDEPDTGLPQILMRWGLLRNALGDLMPDDSVLFGVGGNIAGYTTNEDGTVHLVSTDGDEVTSNSAPLISGADGIYSTFRQCLATDSSALSNSNAQEGRKEGINYNKRVNIKAVVESSMDKNLGSIRTPFSFSPLRGVQLASLDQLEKAIRTGQFRWWMIR